MYQINISDWQDFYTHVHATGDVQLFMNYATGDNMAEAILEAKEMVDIWWSLLPEFEREAALAKRKAEDEPPL